MATISTAARRIFAFNSRGRVMVFAIICLAVVGSSAVVLDWAAVRDSLRQAEWGWIPVALAVTAVSYLATALGFALINRSFGIPLTMRQLLEVGFVSSAMIATVGGLAGHSLRLLFMARQGLAAGRIMAPSLFHGYLESLVFFALIPTGLIYLLLTHPLPGEVAIALIAGTAILGVAFSMTAVVFFAPPVRRFALSLAGRAWKLVTRRDMTQTLDHFEETLVSGFAELRKRPWGLVWALVFISADRIARVGVIWLCFEALGGEVELGVIVTGFAVGIAAGVMSMVPGGLVVQEGSMAGVYNLLGVPLEEAILVSLLFRLLFYMAPFGVSLAFYWPILKGGRVQEPDAA